VSTLELAGAIGAQRFADCGKSLILTALRCSPTSTQ
jgi:hypothetical protein